MVRLGMDYTFFKHRWWTPLKSFHGVGIGNQTGVTGMVYLVPFWIPYAMTVDRLGICINTLFATYGTLRLGLYTDGTAAGGGNPTGGILLCETGTLSILTTGNKAQIFATFIPLSKGIYWGALQTANATGQFMRANSLRLWTDLSGEAYDGATYDNGSYATFQPICPSVTTPGIHPIISMRVVSIDEGGANL